MPSKSRLTEDYFLPSSAKSSGTSTSEKVWDPECEEVDSTDVTLFPTVSVEDESPLDKYVSRSEWISYGNSFSKRMNSCKHIKSRVDVTTGHYTYIYGNRVIVEEGREGRCSKPLLETTTDSVILSIGGAVKESSLILNSLLVDDPYLPTNTQGFRDKLLVLDRIALDTMIPELDDGWSLPQVLFEALELKLLFKQVKELLVKLPSFVRRLFRRPLSEISKQFLSGIFGWLPFVSDVKTFVHKWQNIVDDVDTFLSNANKRQTLHFQKALSPLTFQDEAWFSEDGTLVLESNVPPHTWDFAETVFNRLEFSTKLKRELVKLDYHATLEFSYNIPGLPPGILQLLAELDYWGINLSISDVWEVIPFSFVVDWVVDIGGWLERFDLENLPVQVVIYDFCRSIKYQLVEEESIEDVELVNTDAFFPYTPPFTWTASSSLGSVTRVTDSYYREAGLPSPSAEQLPNWRTPSGLQWVIASALVGSRIKG